MVLRPKPQTHPSVSLADELAHLMRDYGHCRECHCVTHLENSFPPLVAVQLPCTSDGIDKSRDGWRIDCRVNLIQTSYSLAGIVYWGKSEQHFSARLVDESQNIFKYDGMVAGGLVQEDNSVLSGPQGAVGLSSWGTREASIALYVHDV